MPRNISLWFLVMFRHPPTRVTKDQCKTPLVFCPRLHHSVYVSIEAYVCVHTMVVIGISITLVLWFEESQFFLWTGGHAWEPDGPAARHAGVFPDARCRRCPACRAFPRRGRLLSSPSLHFPSSFFLSFSPAASLCGSFAYEGTMTITSPQRVLSPCLGQERWNAIRSCRCLCCPCCFLLFLLHRVCFLRPYSHHNISLPPERFVNCGKMLVARRVMHIVLAHHCNQRCAILCLIS